MRSISVTSCAVLLPVDGEVVSDEVRQRVRVDLVGDGERQRQLVVEPVTVHQSLLLKSGDRFSRSAASPSAASGPRKLSIS